MRNLLATILLFGLVAPASALTILNTFDNDAQGWVGNEPEGTLIWAASGGNPGGHIRIRDAGGGTVNGFASGALAGADFLGDLSLFDGGMMSFDMKTFGLLRPTFQSFGEVRIFGQGGLIALHDVAVNAPSNVVWDSYSFGFDAATFGVSQSDWDAILADVTMIGIATDAFDGGDLIGIDNVKLESQMTPIPLPPGMALMISGLALLGAMHRRR